MSCRESRRARIDELFHEYEEDISKLTQINERIQINYFSVKEGYRVCM